MARVVHAAAFVAAITAVSSSAMGDSFADARAEYEAGAAAYDKKDYATAAIHFNRADEKVPNPRALQLAMASCLNIGEGEPSIAALAMNLVERAEARNADGVLAQLAKKLRQKFAADVGRLRVTCPSSMKCQASVDGRDIDVASPRWLPPGTHRVQVRGDAGGALSTEMSVTPGSTANISPSAAELTPAPPPPAPEPPLPPADRIPRPPPKEDPAPQPRNGLSPVYFWSGVGATALAGGAATFLTLQHDERRQEFLADKNETTKEAGESALTRMQIGLAIAGGLLLTTIVLAIFTDFRGSAARTAAVRLP